jgi:hypothetical protein
MTIERQRMFSCRAQQYMLAYKAIDNNKDESNEPTTAANGGESAANEDKKTTFALIENVIKNYKLTYKTHRSVTDLDTVKKVVCAMKMASYMHEQQQKTRGHGDQQQQLAKSVSCSGGARDPNRRDSSQSTYKPPWSEKIWELSGCMPQCWTAGIRLIVCSARPKELGD